MLITSLTILHLIAFLRVTACAVSTLASIQPAINNLYHTILGSNIDSKHQTTAVRPKPTRRSGTHEPHL